MVYLSSHGTQSHWNIPYTDELFFVFGKESVGLPETLLNTNKDHVYTIPLYSPHIRSLNLANAVSIVVYEGLKHLK